jgi:PPK2 family polyphosphate:nucleotide phosphotransferase
MKIRAKLRAPRDLKLRDKDASLTPLRDDDGHGGVKEREREKTAELVARISRQQEMLYAAHDRKVLLVLQGMDTSGKDGTVRSLFHGINPMGLRAAAFKAPNDEELAHDYLWRVHRQVPGKGEIAIFNRSHYEDVLITRVQGWIDAHEAERRYAHIRDFERMLAETGTVIVKVFLHISKDEQQKRLQERADDPQKHWKFDDNDLVQRQHWGDYQDAYEKAIRATDADHAPWYVIPADSKTHRNLLMATLLLEIMESLDHSFPAPREDLLKRKVE